MWSARWIGGLEIFVFALIHASPLEHQDRSSQLSPPVHRCVWVFPSYRKPNKAEFLILLSSKLLPSSSSQARVLKRGRSLCLSDSTSSPLSRPLLTSSWNFPSLVAAVFLVIKSNCFPPWFSISLAFFFFFKVFVFANQPLVRMWFLLGFSEVSLNYFLPNSPAVSFLQWLCSLLSREARLKVLLFLLKNIYIVCNECPSHHLLVHSLNLHLHSILVPAHRQCICTHAMYMCVYALYMDTHYVHTIYVYTKHKLSVHTLLYVHRHAFALYICIQAHTLYMHVHYICTNTLCTHYTCIYTQIYTHTIYMYKHDIHIYHYM